MSSVAETVLVLRAMRAARNQDSATIATALLTSARHLTFVACAALGTVCIVRAIERVETFGEEGTADPHGLAAVFQEHPD